MSQPNREQRGQVTRHTHPKRSLWKRLYVTALLVLLPWLMKIANAVSPKAKDEGKYIGQDFIFKLAISGFNHTRVIQKTTNSWKGLPGHTEAQLTITFRDLDYAYDVFFGTITLQDALAARLFITHGPNDKAVAISYLFIIILKAFFGWRSAYRR